MKEKSELCASRKVKIVTETLRNLGMFAKLLHSGMNLAAVINGTSVSL